MCLATRLDVGIAALILEISLGLSLAIVSGQIANRPSPNESAFRPLSPQPAVQESQVRRSPPACVPGIDWPSLYKALRQVESSGNDDAIGDGGRSKGPYQIGEAYWQDACEQGNLDWDYDTYVWDRKRCEYIIWLYALRYGAKTNMEVAVIHNGGPNALKYWLKITAFY